MTITALHLWAPGINCQRELQVACERAGMAVHIRHIRELMRDPGLLAGVDLVAFPGGFSYGDDIASGKILSIQLRQYLLPALEQHVASGGLVLGICNGFQTLVKAGLLPGAPQPRESATLTWNDSGRFECRWVRLQPNPQNPGPWVRGMTVSLPIPVAHAEGKFVASSEVLDALDASQQIALRYCDAAGVPVMSYPENPNGSLRSIAGITDKTGRIFGLMPHPDRHYLPTHAPDWTRQGLQEEETWQPLFDNAARYLTNQSVPVA